MAGFKSYESMTAKEKSDFDLKSRSVREMSADEMLESGIVTYPSIWNKCSTAFWTVVVSGLNRVGAHYLAKRIISKRTRDGRFSDTLPEYGFETLTRGLASRLAAMSRSSMVAAMHPTYQVGKPANGIGRDTFYDTEPGPDLVVKFRSQTEI